MKLSNIILLSLIGSVSVAIIAGSLQLRLTGELKSNYYNKDVDTIRVEPFRHLVIHKAWNVTIMAGEKPGIVIQSASGGVKPSIHYHTSGDTLHIDSVRLLPDVRGFWMSVHAPEGLTHISGTNASFGLMNYSGEALTVNLDDSRFSINASDTSRIGRLDIIETNGSAFEAHRVSFDTVAVDLVSSQATLDGEIDKLHGAIMNGSRLRAPGATDIQIRKDSGSTWQN